MRTSTLLLLVIACGTPAGPLRAQEALPVDVFAPAAPAPFTLADEFATSNTVAPTPDADAGATNNDVQRQLAELRAEVDALHKAAAEKTAAAAKPADKPSFTISPQLQIDNYFFGQNTESRLAVGDIPDGSAFRRARIAVLGNYSITEYRLEVDFAQPGRPSFLDVWGALNELPLVGQMKFGYFFEPFGLERLTSNRFAPFLERNLPDQPFSPVRSPGVQFHNQHSDDHGVWSIGVFRPRTDNFGDAVSVTGDWSVTARYTMLPWYDEQSDGRYYLHLGAASSYRRTATDVISFRAQPEARLGAATPNVPFFIDTGDVASEQYGLQEIEFAVSFGSLYVTGEYYLTPVDQMTGPNLLFTGWYAQAGYFLTGEHRPWRRETATFDRVKPFTEFFRVRTRSGVAQGSGAWEIAARISQADLTDANIGGGKLTDLTVGVNWYLTPYMKLSANYVHAFLNPATTSSTEADIFGMRMGYEF